MAKFNRQRKNSIQIPSIIDDLGLSVFAFRLYCCFKYAAAEGGKDCLGISELVEKCKMSRSSVIKARKELEEIGLISVEEREEIGDYYHIVITDIWDKCSDDE